MEYMGIWLPIVIIVSIAALVLTIVFTSVGIKKHNRRVRYKDALTSGLINIVWDRNYDIRPDEDMNCDTELANGHIYFYNTYFIWRPNDDRDIDAWLCAYKDIECVNKESSIKSKITIYGKGSKIDLFLYKANTLVQILEKHIYKVRK